MDTLKRGVIETLPLQKPHPSVNAMLRIQGYKDLTKVRRRVRDVAVGAAELLTKLADPTVSYRIATVNSLAGNELILERDTRLTSRIFAQYLSNANEVIVFALTVGAEVDAKTAELMEQECLVEALFLEAAAWLGVEDATKQFVITARKWAASNGMRITRRLGPGYSYPIDRTPVMWDLEDQNNLFTVFGKKPIPIKLLESAAMLPKMSRSGMYGLIPQ